MQGPVAVSHSLTKFRDLLGSEPLYESSALSYEISRTSSQLPFLKSLTYQINNNVIFEQAHKKYLERGRRPQTQAISSSTFSFTITTTPFSPAIKSASQQQGQKSQAEDRAGFSIAGRP